jgi:hypothetical protein
VSKNCIEPACRSLGKNLLNFSAILVIPFELICWEPFDPDSGPLFTSAPAEPDIAAESADPAELETITSSLASPLGIN